MPPLPRQVDEGNHCAFSYALGAYDLGRRGMGPFEDETQTPSPQPVLAGHDVDETSGYRVLCHV